MQLQATIKPNSKHREEVVRQDDGEFVVYTKSPAVEGRANEAAVRLVAKYFGVSKVKVKLVRGHSSRVKVFEIDQAKV